MGFSIAQIVNKVLPSSVGSNELLFDGSVSWGSNALINDTKELTVDLPAHLSPNATYYLFVTNPSAVTDVQIKLRNRETFDNNTVFYPEVKNVTIPKNSADGILASVEGWLLGDGGVIELSNTTALGPTDSFEATIRVRRA